MGKKETKETKEIILTPEESAAIEAQRIDVEKVNKFRASYAKLVEETGFMWAVDITSPLNNLQLGITRVQK